MEECADGNVRTLTEHLKVLQDYVKSPEFEGDSNETRRKHYFRLRALYGANFVPLPGARLRLASIQNREVQMQTTASGFLDMTKKVLALS